MVEVFVIDFHRKGRKNMRKTRSDCRVGTFEKKNGLPPGTVKKPKTPSPSILIQINRR